MSSITSVVENGKAVLRHLIEMARTRLSLLALDLEEERARFLTLLLACGLILVCISCILLLVILLVIVLAWDTYRLTAIGGLLVFFVALAAGLGLWMRQWLAHSPRPFAATLEELEKDRRGLEEKT
jgi:uncharacterized membrane protein YqjE